MNSNKAHCAETGTFLAMPEAIDQETSLTLPKKTIEAVYARCRKDCILAIFLSMDLYFISGLQMFSK